MGGLGLKKRIERSRGSGDAGYLVRMLSWSSITVSLVAYIVDTRLSRAVIKLVFARNSEECGGKARTTTRLGDFPIAFDTGMPTTRSYQHIALSFCQIHIVWAPINAILSIY